MKQLRWSSSLILAARKNRRLEHASPKILALKRSPRMNSFPRAYVFPGGQLDAADERVDWLSVVPAAERRHLRLNIRESGRTANTVDEETSTNVGRLPKALSLRIAAIRETFEECGILLCRQQAAADDDDDVRDDAATFSLSPDGGDANALAGWRRQVHDDANEFLNLCRVHRCFPDVKALYLLSNWQSPCHSARRFNAAFFIATCDREMAATADDFEIETTEWKSAGDFAENVDIFLAPPQLYELSVLRQFSRMDALQRFIRDVDTFGCEPYTPVQVNTVDGSVFLLPGDGRYVQLFDEQAEKCANVDCDTVDFRDEIMHRIEFRKLPDSTLQRNVLVRNVQPTYYRALTTARL